MDEENDKMVTEQGLGSPVPVGVVSERAGSARPLSSDCPIHLVEPQAGVLEQATGTNTTKLDPFKPSKKLIRSPNRQRTGSLGDIDMLDVKSIAYASFAKRTTIEKMLSSPSVPTDDDMTGNKRRRQEDEGSVTHDIMNAMKQLRRVIKDLKSSILATPNTKADIKKGVTKIDYLVDNIAERCLDLEVFPKGKRSATTAEVALTREASVQVDIRTREAPVPVDIETRDASVQVDIRDVIGEGEQQEQTRAREIRRTIEEAGDFKNLAEKLDIEWPDQVFLITKCRVENSIKTTVNTDLAIFINPKQPTEGDPNRRLL